MLERIQQLPEEFKKINLIKDMGHDHIEEDKKVAFEAENEDVELLTKEGAEKYFKTEFTDLKHAFLKDLKCVVCMDEGTAHKDYNGEGKFCMAGSGILYPAASEEERVQKVAKLFFDLGITDVTSHEGCGAAGLAYKRDFPNSSPTAEDIENYAKDWAKKVSEELGRLGHKESYDHIAAKEMERPPEFHNARVVYYDAVGGFNPNKEVGLPQGFVIGRKFVSGDYATAELKVAADIAFGHHGFGKLFTSELPFTIVVFANSGEELEALKKEAETALKENENFADKKIVVDGMIV